jgi:tetratricopeptide (TPR) repeat protein
MYAYFDEDRLTEGIERYAIISRLSEKNKIYSFPRDLIHKLTQGMEPNEIQDFCKKYLKINPTDTILRGFLAEIFMNRGSYELARAELEDMLKCGHRTAYVFFDLGTCYYHLGSYGKSLECFAKARQLGAYVPQEYFEKVNEKVAREQQR